MQKNREIRGIRKKQLAKLVWLVRVLFHFLCLLSHWLPEALRQSRCIPTRSSIRSSRAPGFVDQGGRGLVQSGSGWLWDARWGGEGGRQAGGWAPLGSAHCWSGAVFQQRRHLCCAHRLSRPKGTPVAPQPPKRKSLHISPFLPHTLPLRQGRIQNSQSTSVMLSWSAIVKSRLVWVAVHPDVSATAPSSKYRSLTMSCPGHRSSTFCPKCPGT